MTALPLDRPPAADGVYRLDTYAVGWSALPACILIADMLGDRAHALDLVDQLVTDHNHAAPLRISMLTWCDMAIQAMQVMDPGDHVLPVDTVVPRERVWEAQLFNARAARDHLGVDRLLRSMGDFAGTRARMLAVLDMCGALVAGARNPHP